MPTLRVTDEEVRIAVCDWLEREGLTVETRNMIPDYTTGNHLFDGFTITLPVWRICPKCGNDTVCTTCPECVVPTCKLGLKQ